MFQFDKLHNSDQTSATTRHHTPPPKSHPIHQCGAAVQVFALSPTPRYTLSVPHARAVCAEHAQTIRMHPHHQMAKVCSTADTRNDAPDGARNISVLCIVSTPVPSPAKHTCARFCPAMAMAMHDDTPFFAILVCMWSGIVHRCASCTHGIRMYPHFMLPPKSRKSDSENANLEKCVCTLRNRLLFAKSSALRNQRFGTVTVPAFAADHITSRTLCSFSFRCTKAV